MTLHNRLTKLEKATAHVTPDRHDSTTERLLAHLAAMRQRLGPSPATLQPNGPPARTDAELDARLEAIRNHQLRRAATID